MSMSSYDNPPPPPGDQHAYYNFNHSTPPKKQSRAVPIVVSGLVGVAIGVAGTLGGIALTNGFSDDDAIAESVEAPSVGSEHNAGSTADDDSEPTPTPSPVEVSYEPTVDDFDVETSVKEQTCFGTAGCNVTLRTEPVYVGSDVPKGSWEVTYEISGIEDGPMIRSFDLIDDQASFDDEAHVSVPEADADIQIDITEVREGFSNR